MSSPRQVVIDDTDNQIRYFGQNWFQDQGSQDNAGNFGPTYQKTSHGTTGNDSISFSFVGNSVTVWGTTELAKIANGTIFDPSWECFVDKISIGSTTPFQYAENNWVLCNQATLNDGPHEMTINVTTTGNTFWLDYITYTPSAAASYEKAVLRVENSDPAILLGAGWGSLGGTANQTTAKGSQAKFDFVGTSLTWVGFIPTEYPHSSAVGTFSIDGGAAVNFKLNGLSATATTTVYNQVFFTTPDLPPAPHSILVTYNGGIDAATPLTLDYILLTNTSLPVVAGATSVSPSPSSTPTSSPSSDGTQTSHSKTPIGAIVGGVVGGLAVIALVLFILWWRQRRRATRIQSSPAYLGTGGVPSTSAFSQPRQPQMHAYASTSSMQNLHPEPFLLTQPIPANIPTQSRSDPSSSGSRSASPYPNGSGRPVHTPTHTPATSLDASDVSGYAIGTVNQTRAIRKGQNMAPAPIVTSVVHQDSGVRLNNPPRPNVVVEDVPPLYTAT
ncbi:hypothetical protein DXG01_010712 [Tephrocybe rancida]|nr:hypothetical protein DXG01_010712 [Tephrocybe rancida]